MAWLLWLAWNVSPALALDPEKAIHQYRLDVWRADEGLPLSSVIEVFQTSDGYLWLGGYEELARFDGVRFQVIAQASRLGNNFNALAEGPGRSLWIGTDGGAITRWQDEGFTTYTARDGLADDHVMSLLVDRDGSLWAGTYDGASRFKDGRFTTYTARDGLPNGMVWALAEDRDGNLWIGTQGGIARLAADGSLETYGEKEGLPDLRISAFHEARDGSLWIGTFGGTLTRFAEGAFAVVTREDLGGKDVEALLEDRDGNFWIGTHGGGLFRWQDGELTSFSLDDGLPSDTVWTLFEDREGSLWIGTEGGGLSRLRDTRFTPVTTRDGLPHDRVWVVDEDREGNLWFGTDGAGLAKQGDGEVTVYTTRDGLWSDNVTALHPGRDGVLWIGTDAGLNRLQTSPPPGRMSSPFTAEIGTPVVLAVLEDRQGNLWVGTEFAGVYRIGDGGVTTYSLSQSIVRALFEDRDGAIWIGTDGGLTRFAGGEIVTYPEVALVRNILQDAQGTLWVGTRGHGLTRVKDGEMRTFTKDDGLYDDVVYHILEDGRDNLWMSCNKGIFRVAKGELDELARGGGGAVRSVVYGTADGMKSTECTGGSQPAGVRRRNGELWFPTAQGLVRIDPEDLPTNELPPPVRIERVLSDGVSLAVGSGEATLLAPGRKSLDFHYTALSLLDPKQVRFKVRLEGYDDHWVDAGSQRFAHYTNMPPGRYRFRVIASNNDGVWNETGDSFDLRQLPAFHQTGTFYGLCVVAAALFGLAVHRLLVRRLLRHNEELRRTQAELEGKNAEVEAKNTEMQRFTYAVSHDLKSPLFTMKGFLGMLEKDVARRDEARIGADVLQIRSAADKMGLMLDELLELSRIGRVVNEPQDVPLAELVQEALEAVAGQIAERRVEVVVDPGLPVVTGDRPRLLGVFQNLLDNAVKYMGDQSRPRIEIGTRQESDGTAVYVRDNGEGIDAACHEKVFDLFHQLNPGAEGSGVGLALVQRIVEVHGGRIWVESAGQGAGSTFALVLPETAAPTGS